jgi:hypothetical protein
MTTSTQPPVLGFGGLMESGKDTAADHLIEQHQLEKVNMSAPIHQFVYNQNPIIDAFIVHLRRPGFLGRLLPKVPEIRFIRYAELVDAVGFTDAKKHDEARAILQRTGYDAARKVIADDVWVRLAERRILELREQGIGAILSGVRFPNEQDLIRGLGGTLVWVERPGHTPAGSTSHATEAGLDPDTFDTVITNSSTLEDLYAKAESVYGVATLPKKRGRK